MLVVTLWLWNVDTVINIEIRYHEKRERVKYFQLLYKVKIYDLMF